MLNKNKFIFNLPPLKKDDPLFAYADELRKLTTELNKETDRGVALFSASVLDDALQKILTNFFVSNSESRALFRYPAPLSGFSARQNLCLALGLITKVEYSQCDIIRKIRNEFAHVSEYSIDFNNSKIKDLCNLFAAKDQTLSLSKITSDRNRINFIITVSVLCIRWKKRLEYVTANKRIELLDSSTEIF